MKEHSHIYSFNSCSFYITFRSFSKKSLTLGKEYGSFRCMLLLCSSLAMGYQSAYHVHSVIGPCAHVHYVTPDHLSVDWVEQADLRWPLNLTNPMLTSATGWTTFLGIPVRVWGRSDPSCVRPCCTC